MSKTPVGSSFSPVSGEDALQVEFVAEDVWVVALPLRPPAPRYTLCYLVRDGDDGLHIIDCGWDTPENRMLLPRAVAAIGSRMDSIRTLFTTHLHRDHLGMATEVRAWTGADVVMHPLEQDAITAHRAGWPALVGQAEANERRGVPTDRRREIVEAAERIMNNVPEDLRADRLVEDGEDLLIPGRRIRAVWTPGHTAGHLCFVDEDTHVIYTGDHVLPVIYPGYGLGGPSTRNPLVDYLASLEKVKEFDSYEVAPGHEHRFRGLAARANAIASHHRARVEEVRAAIRGLGSPTVWDIAARVSWSGGFERLAGNRLRLALNQTDILVDFIHLQ